MVVLPNVIILAKMQRFGLKKEQAKYIDGQMVA